MSRTSASLILVIAVVLVLAGVTVFALYIKGDVRASGRMGSGSFSIETTEKRK